MVSVSRCSFRGANAHLMFACYRFSTLFVEALPTDYFQRVWDIFLSEGVHSLLLLSNLRRLTYSRHGISPPCWARHRNMLPP